jgi:hypothetical protein
MAPIHKDHREEDASEPDTRRIDVKPLVLGSLDPARIQISFDHRSDTLLIHLFGRDRDTISVPVAKYLYVLVDPETEQVIGVHIEGFLAQAVKDVPAAIALLDFAELRGISPAEVRVLRARSGADQPLRTTDSPTLCQTIQERRRDAVISFIAAERERWNLPFLPAA